MIVYEFFSASYARYFFFSNILKLFFVVFFSYKFYKWVPWIFTQTKSIINVYLGYSHKQKSIINWSLGIHTNKRDLEIGTLDIHTNKKVL